MNKRELKNLEILKRNSPLAYEKAMRFPEKIKNGETIASIQIQYRYVCNFMCKHCAIEKFAKKKGKLLTPDTLKMIADQADEMGLAGMSLSGGEPLMFKDLEALVKAIGPKRFNICCDTNGWLLDEKKIDWLIKIGVHRLHLSIDGNKENHDSFRNIKGSWDRCMKALKYAEKIDYPIIVNIVVTKSMVHTGELERQLQFLDGHYASLIYAKPTGTFEQYKDEILNTRDINYVEGLVKKYNATSHLTPCYGNDFKCFALKRHFAITAVGDLLPCPWIPIYLGNIYEEKLKDIVNRGLSLKWFTYKNKFSCLSGNTDGYFYQKIMPQIEASDEYPVSWEKINWKGGD